MKTAVVTAMTRAPHLTERKEISRDFLLSEYTGKVNEWADTKIYYITEEGTSGVEVFSKPCTYFEKLMRFCIGRTHQNKYIKERDNGRTASL